MIGQTVSHYRIVSRLGAGGMGEVYRARDERLGRDVAVKLLSAELAAELEQRRRFEQEMRAAAALNHPGILAVYDVGDHKGRPYLVTELLEGATLRERLREGRIPARKAVTWGAEIADALSAAHEHRIIHRDLKPENLFITTEGRVKILDFGLAKVAPPLPAGDDTASVRPRSGTDAGTVLGTVGYMSPEQLRGQAVDPRADIFALGCVLYEMLSGQRAFHGATAADTISAILSLDPPPLPSGAGEIPAPLQGIVSQCLEKRPEDRFSSTHDIALALRLLSTPSETSPSRQPVLDDSPSRPTRFRGWMRRHPAVSALAAAVVVLALATMGWWLAGPHQAGPGLAAPAPRITSLAVKPLDDFSGDRSQGYLSDGMTEALCSALGNISALRVPGRSTVMRYKGAAKSIQEMARELNVDAVVEGSVQREGDRILVSVQLIEAATDRHLWSTRFERDLSDFFKVQSEVAQAIAAEVQVRLTPEDQARLARARAAKPETVEACLRGMQQWWLGTEESTTRALRYFEKAVESEPEYAPAHAGMALAYIAGSGWVQLWPPLEGVPKGKAFAQKAIQLDPALVDAYVARGIARENFDWDWAGAEKDFQKALELNPNSILALDSYGFLLYVRGRHNEATALLKKALELDPLEPMLHNDLGFAYLATGRTDRAIAYFQRALELNPDFHQEYWNLGFLYMSRGKSAEAATEFQTLAEAAPEIPWALGAVGYFYGATGRREEAGKVLDKLDELRRKRYVTQWARAITFIGLGDKTRALDSLEEACAEHDGWIWSLNSDPWYDMLRDEPRFQALVKKVMNGGQALEQRE